MRILLLSFVLVLTSAFVATGQSLVAVGPAILLPDTLRGCSGKAGIKGQSGEEPEDGRVKFEGAIYTSPLLGKNFLFWGANGECHEGGGEWRFGSVAVSS